MSTEILHQAADIAERLAGSLRLAADNTSLVAGPRCDLADLEKLLPELRLTLTAFKRARSLDQIASATGNADTHPWEVDPDSGEVRCPVCQTHPVGYLLADGRVPVCDATSTCQHAVLGDGDDAASCIYCKTVYPTTAELVGGAR